MKEEILKTYHRENKIKKSVSTFIGSTLLIVSAILPCIDRILVFWYPELDTIRDSRGVILSSNIWIASVYLSPVFIITSFFFKTNIKLYFFPLLVFFYSAIVYYSPIFGYDIKFLAVNSWIAFIASVIAAAIYVWLFRYMKWLRLEENANDNFLSDVKEEYKKLITENNNLKNKLQSYEKK